MDKENSKIKTICFKFKEKYLYKKVMESQIGIGSVVASSREGKEKIMQPTEDTSLYKHIANELG
jgi:hypothetical protein